MSRIFISYSRQDEPFARRLATDLDTLGADIWIDVDDIPAGMKWSTAIQQGLKSCEVMIVIISQDAMASRHVEDEWQYYLDDGKPVIPVLLRPADVHFQLRRIQYIDFHAQAYTAAFRQLRDELVRNGLRLDPLPVDLAGTIQPPSRQGPLHPPHRKTPPPASAAAPAGILVKVVAAGAALMVVIALLIALAVLVIAPALRGDDDHSSRDDITMAHTATPTPTGEPTATLTAAVPHSPTPFIFPSPAWEGMGQATVVAGLRAISGNADYGASLFRSACAACHDPTENGIAPAVTGISTRAATRIPGLSAREYLYTSIVAPDYFIVDGYANLMPGSFTEQYSLYEILDIVGYLMTQ